jgi:hypothetical protein
MERLADEPIPQCSGIPVTERDYCVKPALGQLVLKGEILENDVYSPAENYVGGLGECEGDCNHDNDCAGDLRCFQREEDDPLKEVPGCLGTGAHIVDYCYKPLPTSEAPSVAVAASPFPSLYPSAAPTTKLGHCEVGCESHLHCAEGHKCRSNVFGHAPFGEDCDTDVLAADSYCSVTQNGELDYIGNGMAPGALKECQGDCDDDVDCAYGLICFERLADEVVASCKGLGISEVDYCVKPPSNTTLIIMGDVFNRDNFPFGMCQGDCDTDDDCKVGILFDVFVTPYVHIRGVSLMFFWVPCFCLAGYVEMFST